jgi:hypothetical protein
VHRNRRDIEFLAGPQNAQGYLAAIGDEHLIQDWHCFYPLFARLTVAF